MELTKNDLKQLIREMMEAEEMEAAEELGPDVEETEGEGLDFDNPPSGVYKFPSNYWIIGPERDRAKEEDDGMKALEDHVMEGGEGLILGKSNGRINVLIVFRDINPFTGLDRGVGWGREGWSGGGTRGGLDLSPEDALKYLKRGAELIQDEAAKSAFMSVTEEDLENMPDNTYFVAKTKKKEPEKERPKSRPSRRYERPDDYYHDSRRDRRSTGGSYRPFKRFEENKLTQSRLKQMIREVMFGEQLNNQQLNNQKSNKQIKDALTGKLIPATAFSKRQIDNGILDAVRKGELVAYIGKNGRVLTPDPEDLEIIKNARAARAKGQTVTDALTGKPIKTTAFSMDQLESGIPDMVRSGRLVAYRDENGQVQTVTPGELQAIKNMRARANSGAKDQEEQNSLVDAGKSVATRKAKKGSTNNKRNRRVRGKKPIFLRKYRKYIKLMKEKFGAINKDAFDKFYNHPLVKMPDTPRYRDYQFGRTHARKFDSYLKKIGRVDAAEQGDLPVQRPTQPPRALSELNFNEVLKQIIREELKKKVLEQTNVRPPKRKQSIIDRIYDATGGKAESDFPKYYRGPADRVSKMANRYDYARKTEQTKEEYDASMAIASLISLGGAAVVASGTAKVAAPIGARIKAYLAGKGIEAPAIATSTYADYKQIELEKGKKPKSEREFKTVKNLILNLLPTKSSPAVKATAVTGGQLE